MDLEEEAKSDEEEEERRFVYNQVTNDLLDSPLGTKHQ